MPTPKKTSPKPKPAPARGSAVDRRTDLVSLAGAIAASPAGHTMQPAAIAERAQALLSAIDESLAPKTEPEPASETAA